MTRFLLFNFFSLAFSLTEKKTTKKINFDNGNGRDFLTSEPCKLWWLGWIWGATFFIYFFFCLNWKLNKFKVIFMMHCEMMMMIVIFNLFGELVSFILFFFTLKKKNVGLAFVFVYNKIFGTNTFSWEKNIIWSPSQIVSHRPSYLISSLSDPSHFLSFKDNS